MFFHQFAIIKAIITTRNRSLRRLCFYTCLSVIMFTGGVCPSACWDAHPPGPETGTLLPPPGPEADPSHDQRQAPHQTIGRHPPPRERCMLGDTGNKRAVRILLESILVFLFVLLGIDLLKSHSPLAPDIFNFDRSISSCNAVVLQFCWIFLKPIFMKFTHQFRKFPLQVSVNKTFNPKGQYLHKREGCWERDEFVSFYFQQT